MTQSLAEFVEHRVNALAYVMFTRRDALVVTHVPRQGELDLFVQVKGLNGRQMRLFGVVLRGTPKLLHNASASRELNIYFRHTDKGRGPVRYPFPVLAVILSMENDQGFYDWRCEPRAPSEGGASLRIKHAMDCKSFTKSGLDEVARSVNNWYDELFDSIYTSME